MEAILHEDNLKEEWRPFTELNAEMALQCPVITDKKEPLAERGSLGLQRSGRRDTATRMIVA